MKQTLFSRLVWALFSLALMVNHQSAQAFSISSYDQHAPGKADGVIVIDGVDYSITQIAVQVALPESPVEFELSHTGQRVQIMIIDPHDRVKSSALTITAISDQHTIHRTFVVKGRAPHSPSAPAQPIDDSLAPDESGLELAYAALPSSNTVPESAMEITITDGQRAHTVRDAIELLLFNTATTLNERPGDERVLDLPLNPAHPINRLEDLYGATNGKIGHIYIDDNALVIMPKAMTRRIMLNPDSESDTLTTTASIDKTPDTPPVSGPRLMSLRVIVESLAVAEGRVLDEQLGDDRVLDQRIEVADPITDFEQLYALPNKPVKRVIFDDANETRTVRIL